MSVRDWEAKTAVLAELDPPIVWQLFEQISRIPRCSKKEQEIRSWIREWADKERIPCREDGVGNLLLTRAASPGFQNIPTLILQAHLDMVCLRDERADLNFDFDKDPIRLRVEGSTVRAEGTTLGADNGIGVAYCLAALSDPQLTFGRLEVLLTVDEEEGATGALGLKSGFFSGQYLLNLDSEETGIITIGTAGFEITDYTIPLGFHRSAGCSAVTVAVRGLAGGHSGLEIHLPRLNAIKMAAQALAVLGEFFPVRLGCLEGGESANSIPSGADCIVFVPEEALDRALDVLQRWREQTLAGAGGNEPGLEISMARTDPAPTDSACTIEETRRICGLLAEIPHGPLAFSGEIEGLVETSNNIARVSWKKTSCEIKVSCRSSVESALGQLSARLGRIGESYGVEYKKHSRLPGWIARPDSRFNRMVQSHYRQALGRPVILKAYHAGLECGVFKGVAPELQMASIGPDIHSVHTPQENVDIRSVAELWDVLRRIIEGMRELAERS